LASNSLLEGLVIGGRAGKAAAAHASNAGWSTAALPEAGLRRALPRADLQRAMTRHAAVVRDEDGLRKLSQVLDTASPRKIDSRKDFEDAALTSTAGAVMAAALERTESRGCHHRADYPNTDPAMARSLAPAVVCA
jgi:L-aspartate oxidase